MTMSQKTRLSAILAAAVVIAFLLGISQTLAIHEILGKDNGLAEECTSCHGEKGISPLEGVPHLAGQHAAYMEAALGAYALRLRTEPSMQAATAGLSAEEITRLAHYFSVLPSFNNQRPEEPQPYSEPDPFFEVREAIEGCSGCHGGDGNSEIPGMPGLAGQNESYLTTALKAYQAGGRGDETMQYFTEELSETQIETLALYYSRLEAKAALASGSGDPFAGQAPAIHCTMCHGEEGNNIGPDLPRIAGQDGLYLETALAAYADGLRSHDLMETAVLSLSARQGRDVVAFFASQKPISARLGTPLTAPGWAERCDRCHGAGGNSTDVRFPKLAGQSESYLIKALKLYHGNGRPSTVMNAMSFVLSEPQIMDLAAYYARMGVNPEDEGE